MHATTDFLIPGMLRTRLRITMQTFDQGTSQQRTILLAEPERTFQQFVSGLTHAQIIRPLPQSP